VVLSVSPIDAKYTAYQTMHDCIRGGLDWILGKISLLKEKALAQAAQGSG